MQNTILIAPSVLLLLAATSDLRSRRIPDAIPLLLATSGIVHAAWASTGAALAVSVFAALACFAVGLILFSLGQLGGGDVKLIAAMMFWLPGHAMWSFLILTAMAGGLVCLVAAAARFASVALQPGGLSNAFRAARAATAPYAIAIAVGGLMAMPWRGV